MSTTLRLSYLSWQREFLENSNRVKALSGASDTGKSWICRVNLILNCLTYTESQCFISATTWTQTERAVVEPILSFLKEHKIDHYCQYSKGEGTITFKNRSRIEIISSEKLYDRIKSREFLNGFLEEVTAIPENDIEKIYTESIRRLRQKAYDKAGNRGCNQLLMATNPDIKTRWIYTHFFNNPPENSYIKMLAFKDGFNAYDKEREANILMGSKRQIDLYYHGLWGNLEGVAFILEDGVHIREVDELEKYYITFDYGFHPNPMVYLLVSIKEGIVYVVDEIVLDSVPVNRHDAYLEQWTEKYNIVGYTGETATGAGEIRDLLNRYNIRYSATIKKRSMGWTTIADLIDRRKLVVDPRCKKTIESLSSMCWVGSTQGVDCEGEFEDPADALRYFVMCPMIYNKVGMREINDQRKVIIK